MTDIEELWNSAVDDAEQQQVAKLLQTEMVIICCVCGSDTDLDTTSGCYTCKGCGDKSCGDS